MTPVFFLVTMMTLSTTVAAQIAEVPRGERGRYRFERSVEAEGTAEELYEQALRWMERSHAGTNESVDLRDAARGRILARGTFLDRRSDVSDIIYYLLEVETRDGGYRASYDSFIYQAGPTHHALEFERMAAGHDTVLAKAAGFVSEALGNLHSAMIGHDEPVEPDPPDLRLDTLSYRLSHSGGAYRLHHDGYPPLSIPHAWLAPPDNPERDSVIAVRGFSEKVTAFPVGMDVTALHLSSYEIEPEGSAQLASGRDVFLFLDENEGSLHDGQMLLGISKERGRSMGCWWAVSHRFLIGDVDGDGLTDVGFLREEINCIGYDELVEQERTYPIKWHLFTDSGWEYYPAYDGDRPNDAVLLPLIDLRKTPTDFVREMNRPR